MSTVQVALSFAVEFWKFHNIDLFHQGAFQIRSYLRSTSNSPVIIEPPKIWDRSKNAMFPECVSNSFVLPADPKTAAPAKAVSKSVLIIYKEESLRMHDVFEQTMHFQIEAFLIEELIYKSEIVLVVELWFAEKKNDSFEEMKNVCERQLKVHFIPSQGLHHHITVMFDYYYLAAVEVVVHASLVSISPCYLKLPQSTANDSANNFDKNVSLYQSWHSILFNTGKNCGRRHTACHIHTHLCRLLLAVIDSLFGTFQTALSYLSSEQRSRIDEKLRAQLCPFQGNSSNWMKYAPNELERLVTILQSQTCEEDMADQASIDITKLSSRVVVLFNEYLKKAACHSAYVEALTVHTHKLRIKRFSEAFFVQEFSIVHLLAVYDPKYANPMYLYHCGPGRSPLPSATPAARGAGDDEDSSLSASSLSLASSPDDNKALDDENVLAARRSSATLVRRSTYNYFSTNGHETLAAKVRDSSYYRQLPPLPVECPDTDGQSHDQPIIIEEVFLPETRRTVHPEANSLSSSSSSSDGDGKTTRISSIYKKKRKDSGSSRAIPVARRIHHGYDRKDLPVQPQRVSLVGYRSLDCSAFDSPPVASNGDVPDAANSRARRGLGTLERAQTSPGGTLDIDTTRVLSRSMPDLSHIDHKVRLRNIRGRTKKSELRFSSIYEIEETSSWSCARTGSLSQSTCNLSLLLPEAEATSGGPEESLTILEMLSSPPPPPPPPGAVGQSDETRLTFHELKARLLADLRPQFQGQVYSDLAEPPASRIPYFSLRDREDLTLSTGLHFVVCVHGLDGEHRDLRLVRAYLGLALPEQRFEFLMSEANENDTFADIGVMSERLVDEVLARVAELPQAPDKVSFIGHSLGCVLVRAAVANPRLAGLVPRLHTFLSLGGPHLGTVYGSSVLVNVGLWVMQKVRKSACLQQLGLKDSLGDLRRSYLYGLSGQPGLEHFRFLLLASSPQDRYVPYHSTRIELCRAAVRDNSEMGVVYMEMVTKLLQRLLRSGRTTVVRYDAHYTLPRSANNYIGRAAHIALIDSELFLEKLISVSAAKYFR